MLHRIHLYLTILVIGFFAAGQSARAQTYVIRGSVYDSSRSFPLVAVSVLSTSGKGTITNSEGVYQIEVTEKDSIWFSYLNKPTMKFPVLKIANTLAFDISLQVNIPTLKEVKIRPKNYKQDSIQNRIDYAKAFNYQKPKIKPSVLSSGVGFDLDEIINMFRFRRNRSMASFQKRLLQDEEDKFVEHRFSKALVRRLTLLESPQLDTFMLLYRPNYTFTKMAGDYEFMLYIKNAAIRFKQGSRPDPFLKEGEQEQ